jgi:hypothetical protein
MFSDAYYRIVENGKQFHTNTKSWNGLHSIPYAKKIKELVEKHDAKSLLDYGCGKGYQYTMNTEWEPGVATTLDKYLGVSEVGKFDPCWPEFDRYPSLDKKYDGVILIQCLGFIPDDDLIVLRQHLETLSTKFCYIGELFSGTKADVKPKKLKLIEPDNCTIGRSVEWYKEKFAGWQGPELIFDFI